MLKKALKIFGLVAVLMLYGQQIRAQDFKLIMEMVVTNDGKKMPGATVELRKGGSLVKSFVTDGRGAVDVPVPANGNYEITISGSGMIKKKIAVNTANVPAEALKGESYFPAEVDIFPKVEGLDYKILDEPIGIIRYDPEFEGFDADLDYTKRRKAALDKLTADYQKQKANEEKLMAQKQKEYDIAIKAADKAFNSEQWELAEQEYKKAADILPMETYPSFQLAELETKLIKIRETNAKYDEAIKLADQAFASKDYQRAVAEYKRASGYKPDEAYPQNKLKETQDLLANQLKAEQNYLAAIEKGDNALKINDLNTAKTAFEEAAAAKPDEVYPKNKLAEINDILGKQQAKEQEYQAAIKAADEALAAKDYPAAKSNYQKALGVKPTESYPQEQITKVDELLAAAAKRDQNYLAAIEQGDNALAKNDLQTALTAFNQAKEIKPEETYPTNKIKEINDLIAKNEAKEKEYQDKIKEADKLLGSESYAEAKTAYQAAATLKPTEAYPKDKITEIEGILAAKAEQDKKYQEAIAAADKAMEAKDYEAAKQSYTSASQLKPNEKYPQDQLAAIGTILVKIEENQAKYDEAIKNADEALAAKDLAAAQKFYTEAKGVKPNESYPQTKLDEIAALQKQQAEAQAAYDQAIAAADAAMKENKLEVAKTEYGKAQQAKPEESYPQEQLSKIEGMLADAAKLEEEYNAAIQKADAAFTAKDYKAAIAAYNEALGKKANEQYPKDKIAEAEGLIKAAEEKEAQYAEAIKTADKAFQDEKYEEAKSAYQNALSIKEDQYPKDQIAAADQKLAELAAAKAAAEKLEADYQAAITEGQSKLDAQDFAAATAAFQKAASLKPDEKLPQDKLAEIEAKKAELAEQERLAAEKAAAEKLEADYQAALSEGDSKFQEEDFAAAIAAYQKAAGLKPDEKLPTEKIAEVEARQKEIADQKAEAERLAALQKEYDAKIAAADQAMAAKQLKEARTAYQEALALKAEESYPKEKIEEINGILADAAEQDELYNKAIADADKLFAKEDLEGAKTKYQEASSIKSEESYPKEKITEIDDKLAALAAEAEAIRVKQEKEAAQKQEFDALMAAGDELAKQSEYNQAIGKYEAALAVMDDQAPKDKIEEMKAEIAEREAQMAEAAKAERDAKYQALVDEADAAFKEEDFATALEKYNAALAVKEDQYPKDQISAIKAKQAELAAAKEQAQIEQEYQAYIAEADAAFNDNNFATAIDKYTAALEVKEDQYPKDQIAAAKAKAAELAAANEQAEVEEQYQALIAEADAKFEVEAYDVAKSKYNDALTLKQDQYPKDQIAKINTIQAEKAQAAEIAQKEAQYQTLIAEADGFMETQSLDEAEAKYQAALAVMDKQYPKDQLKKIADRKAEIAAKQSQLAAQAALEENYKNVIASADQAFKAKEYQRALEKYQEAISIKEGETYPAEKIQEINALLAAAKAKDQKQAQYDQAIAAADAAMQAEDYGTAKGEYQKALSIKPNEVYPQEQIAKADQLLAAAQAKAEEIRLQREREAQNEAAYQTAIQEGDQLFSGKKYEEAINKYELALGLKPSKSYPAEQIQRIREAQSNAELEAKRRAKEAEDREKRYKELIATANASFESKDYAMAKREYEAALSMKPGEIFPKARIKEIESILRGQQSEEEEKLADEPIQIQKGPKSTIDGSAEAEIDRIYKEMWAKKNVEKNQMIADKREVVKKLREEDKEKETSKRLNAIERIENISVSFVEQRQTSDELHLQNYETVKSETKVHDDKVLELTKESERKRNGNMIEKDRTLESIAEYRRERGEEIVSGKKEAVEEDYENEEEFRKEHSKVQQERIEKLDEEYVQKDEDIRNFNKERLDVNHQANSKQLAKNEEEWKERVTEFQEGSSERTEEEKEKIYQKEVEIREFNREKNTVYMDGYEVVKEKTKKNEEFIDEEQNGSLDKRMREQEKINDVSVVERERAREGNEIPSENYIEVVEKTEALDAETKTLNEESEERRQANLKKEFYEGEDKPRQDPESAKYPQGVSEKIIENENGSTTIRRIKVEGTETDIYEKTLHPYGAVFYTKNGSNITKETWDAESK